MYATWKTLNIWECKPYVQILCHIFSLTKCIKNWKVVIWLWIFVFMKTLFTSELCLYCSYNLNIYKAIHCLLTARKYIQGYKKMYMQFCQIELNKYTQCWHVVLNNTQLATSSFMHGLSSKPIYRLSSYSSRFLFSDVCIDT